MDKKTVLKCIEDNVEEIRRRFAVRSPSIFGSIARDETSDKSDVDVSVAFDRKANFDTFIDLKFYLEELLGAKVDLVTDKALRPQVRRAIEGELINVA